MSQLRAISRLLVLILWLLLGVVLALITVRVSASHTYTARQRDIIRWWSQGLLACLGVAFRHRGVPHAASVWVANHQSWLDIVVLLAIEPCRFLSKHEVARWPVIGWLAQRSGTVFLHRGQGETGQAIRQLAELAQAGDAVLFFPEGTTTAHEPKLFHARLFALPIEQQLPVQPIMMRYADSWARVRQDIAYVGQQSFLANLWYLLQQQHLVAEVVFLTVIAPTVESRRHLSSAAHEAIVLAWRQDQV